MAAVAMGSNFPKVLSQEIFNKVRGKSSLAKLSQQIPVAFTGTDVFTFDFDHEVSIVAEGAAKVEGGAAVAPVTIKPVKVEYGARVTDEFLYASEERQLEILGEFVEAFSRKLAKGLDLMALHGVNIFLPHHKNPVVYCQILLYLQKIPRILSLTLHHRNSSH
jgi:HK97 family phage major capsid protein